MFCPQFSLTDIFAEERKEKKIIYFTIFMVYKIHNHIFTARIIQHTFRTLSPYNLLPINHSHIPNGSFWFSIFIRIGNNILWLISSSYSIYWKGWKWDLFGPAVFSYFLFVNHGIWCWYFYKVVANEWNPKVFRVHNRKPDNQCLALFYL